MKRIRNVRFGGWISSGVRFAEVLSSFTLVIFLLSSTAWAAGTVTSCTESALRAALAGGGTVKFACDGTITLASTVTNTVDAVLDGSGHQVTISGGSARRVFFVNTNVTFTLSNLTIAHGLSDTGAGICNAGGHLTLQNCTLINNSAIGPDGASYSGSPGTNACGGAVYNSGLLNAVNCTFISNSAAGGIGATSSSPSGTGGSGGDANGGAIGNCGVSIVTGCLLANNSARGGTGGAGGAGAYGYSFPNPGGAGGAGGAGQGGALFNKGVALLVNNTFTLNLGAGGQGGDGGSGSPPSSQSSYSGDGGNGGNGGAGYSALYDANGQLYLTNGTVALNPTTAGTGGFGGPAGPWVYPDPPLIGQPGGNGASGAGGSGLKTGGAHLLNTILSGNSPSNCIGIIADAGHNLSSDGSCTFTNVGSLNNTDPKLGPLADNGGPTLTMALLPGSPAINAGDPLAAPATDQRGVARPQGPGVDIGAFEYQYVPIFTDAKFQNPTDFWLQMSGLLPDQAFTLQASTNLLNWVDLTNLVAGKSLLNEFVDGNLGQGATRFYRLKAFAP